MTAEAWRKASPPARAAVDMALHDVWGQLAGEPLYRLLGTPSSITAHTSTTLSWDTPVRMAAQARDESPGPLKLKIGPQDAEECVRAVREVSAAPLRVDANASLSVSEAERLLPRLAELGVELLEQPLAVGDTEGLLRLSRAKRRPALFIDESAQTLKDIDAHAGSVDGVVVKLAKAGGVRSALEQMRHAQTLGLSVMVSCMVESSIAVTAAAHIAGAADLVDLDGPLLIRQEPWQGVAYAGRRLLLPTGSGLGLSPRSG